MTNTAIQLAELIIESDEPERLKAEILDLREKLIMANYENEKLQSELYKLTKMH